MSLTRRQALLSSLAASAAPLPQSGSPVTPGPAPSRRKPRAEEEPVSLPDFERLARKRLPHPAYEYLDGGAAEEITVRANRAAFEAARLLPRALVDVSKLETRVRLVGRELSCPILLAPTAYHRVFHPEGELATARGAKAADVAYVVSTSSTTAIEEIRKESDGELWFQLYVLRDRGLTREIVQRAEAAGCGALCLTIDQPTTGVRDRERRSGFRLPPGTRRAHQEKLGDIAGQLGRALPGERNIYNAHYDPALGWPEIERLIASTRMPVLLKGILNPADAEEGIRRGAAGIIVSNHGGRNLDGVPATLEALPPIVEKVGGRVPVLMDGGIRRGTDVVVALAQGAQAVLIGRPYLCGLAAQGAEGVTKVANLLRQEFEIAMALLGRSRLTDIDRSVLWTRQV
jgi:4-hydroxymandelate oxidase